uniref:intermembrane phospholipid transport protein YdbH family protein n=1 Tax=uncultured Sphingomonas sp. TaxID=158754 RepID=UPI0035CB0040
METLRGPGPSDRPPLLGRDRRRYRIGAVAILIVVALACLWLARKPVAEHFVDDALRARGIPAQYEIEKIGLRTQRLTHVRIGDPAHPDLLADWIEIDTSLWFSGASVTALRVGQVQVRARLVNGGVSFGTIDRLLPARSGKRFALPQIDTEIADARIALQTPQGDVALTVKGAGRLDNGFAGTIGASAAELTMKGCRVSRAAATLQVLVANTRPSLAGPITFDRGICGGAAASGIRADVSTTLDARFDHWNGEARLRVAALAAQGARLRDLSGPVVFVGSATDVTGTVDLRSGAVAAGGVTAAGGAIAGRYRYAGGGVAFDGSVNGVRAALPTLMLARLEPVRSAGAATPLGPILTRIATAAAAAGRSVDFGVHVSTIVNPDRGQVLVSRVDAAAASGARLHLSGGNGIAYRWPGNGVRIATDVSLGGGGLPDARLHLAQAAPGAPLTGRAVIAPYAAGRAQLALAPIDFTISARGAAHVTTHATLSGPIGTGQIEGLSMPLAVAWDGATRLTVNPDCIPVTFDRLRMPGLDMPRSSVTLCPLDGGLVRLADGVMHGGGGVGPVRLGARLGSSPLELTLRRAEWRLSAARFAIAGLGVRLGPPERPTRLELASLDGGFGTGGASGVFAGAGGQIGAVPLLLSGAAGQWRFADGKLALGGTLTVADTASDPRFKPLAARDVGLTLAGNRIAASGALFEPASNVKVADVTLAHDLAAGAGHADIAVPGITFGAHFQPDQLTRLTFGVIADVAGSVTGDGHIRWTPRGVTSDGVFRTTGVDLAAAFGPATGIAGEIRFTDLLALQSAPGQVATIKTLNPGIAVNDGTVRYQLLPGARIAVEQGRWPFAGGTLTLEPTLLDFDKAQARHLTFRIARMQAAQFLQQFDFKNLDATGVFDGVLPMVFDQTGGRIEQGHLVVQPGGGAIAYVGDITQKDVGFWGNFAFQALKSLRYRNLEIVMNGPLAGEMITEVRFAGIGQGAGAKRNFLFDRLQKLPLVFNVKIAAPFRQLIDSAQSFYDPKRLIERNLPALLEEQRKRATPPPAPLLPIQPSDSRIVP